MFNLRQVESSHLAQKPTPPFFDSRTRCGGFENDWKYKCIKSDGDKEVVTIANKVSEKIWFDIDEYEASNCQPGAKFIGKEIVFLEKNSEKTYELNKVEPYTCREFYIINCRTDKDSNTHVKCLDYLTVFPMRGSASPRQILP